VFYRSCPNNDASSSGIQPTGFCYLLFSAGVSKHPPFASQILQTGVNWKARKGPPDSMFPLGRKVDVDSVGGVPDVSKVQDTSF
jgi:hypothetical protein